MSFYGFDFMKCKLNERFKSYSDYDLVKKSQDDVDIYRKDCHWECPHCGYTLKYRTSLLIEGKTYVHEMRCPNKINSRKKKCNKKMIIIKKDGSSFDSVHFDELFARYQDRIINESRKSSSIDSPDEVYCVLSAAFSKIVLQFNREEKYKEKTDKWFSSFFWTSMQNKIADLQKTNTYNKRCPTVECMICKKRLGQITVKHLYKSGHDALLKEILIDYGVDIMTDSGEISFYLNEESLNNRALYLGKKFYYNRKSSERKKLFELKCFSIYSKMFPESIFKNNVLSVNAKVKKEGDKEYLDLIATKEDLCTVSFMGA